MSTPEDGGNQQRTFHVVASIEVSERPTGQPETQEHGPQAETKHERRILLTQIIIAFAAVAALAFTLWSMWFTRETFRTARRAWVLRGEQINPLPKDAPQPDQPWSAEVFLRNVGESPALDLMPTHSSWKITGTIRHVPDDPKDWDKYRTATTVQAPAEEQPSRSLLGPGQQKMSIVSMPILSADEIGMVEREELAVYIVSWLIYRDIFKITRHTVECTRIMLKPRRLVDCGGDSSRAD